MGDIAERLVRYCAIASPSSPDGAGAVPSTPSQHAMAALLGRELEELGAEDVSVDAHAYVTAH